MDLKKLLPMLLMLAVFAGSAQAATGDVDLLCSAISDDLSAAGGCIDDDDLEDTVTSTGGLYVLEVGDSASLLTLAFVGIVLSIVALLIIEGFTGGISNAISSVKKMK